MLILNDAEHIQNVMLVISITRAVKELKYHFIRTFHNRLALDCMWIR